MNAVTEDGAARPVSFMRDVYPVLRSISLLKWVNRKGSVGHGSPRGDFLQNDAMVRLSDNDRSQTSAAYTRRQSIFARIRDPRNPDRNSKKMPSLPEDVIGAEHGENGIPYDISAVTPLQYTILEKWRDGHFEDDFDPDVSPCVAFEDIAVDKRPSALDLAALEGSAGTPLFPGIESWSIMRERALYAAPLRICAAARPGDLTMGNALPWQADYLDCMDTWWPVQRPDLVWRDGGSKPWVPAEWENNEPAGFNRMVEHWSHLGFVVGRDDGSWFEEVERDEKAIEGAVGGVTRKDATS
jgi:hypothetical protein